MKMKTIGSLGAMLSFLFSFGSVWLSRWNNGTRAWVHVSGFSCAASLFMNIRKVSLPSLGLVPQEHHGKTGLYNFWRTLPMLTWDRYALWRFFRDKAHFLLPSSLCLQVQPGSLTSHPSYRNGCSIKECCKQWLLQICLVYLCEGITTFWPRWFFVVWGCPVDCRKINIISDFYPLNASSILPPFPHQLWQADGPQRLPDVSWKGGGI